MELGILQRRALESLEGDDLLGARAVARIEKIFTDHMADPAGAAKGFDEVLSSTNELQTRIDQLVSGLGPMVEDIEAAELEEGQARLTLVFQGEIDVVTVSDLEKQSEAWRKILSAFARLSGEGEGDLKIQSIGKGSLFLELLGATGLVYAIANGASKVLEVYERVLNIRRHAAELRKLELSNDEIPADLEKEADAVLEQAAGSVAEDLIKQHKLTGKKGVGEIRNAVSLSLRQIFVFVEKGGILDVRSPSGNGAPPEPELRLRGSFRRVKELEGRLAELKQLASGLQPEVDRGDDVADEQDEQPDEDEEEEVPDEGEVEG